MPPVPHTLRVIDLVVLVLYLLIVVGLGIYMAKRSKTTEGFMAAGGALPAWAVGLSIFGTFVSSISFLANPGKAFDANWNPFVFGLSLPLAAWIATRYFVPFFRRTGEVSAYSHLEARFGPWARVYAVLCYLLTQMGRIGTILYLVALALAPLTGWSVVTIILLTGVLVTLYTLIGGIEAVIWTDVVQSLVLTLGIVLCLGVIFMGMPEGPGQVFRLAAESDKFSLGSYGLSLSEPTFWVILVFGLFINLQNFGIDQSYVQRYATAKSEAAAKRSVWLGALLYVPISGLLFLIGTGLFAFYQAQPELLPETVGKGDKVFPFFIATQLPPGITGILIAAVLAAAMSSVDSSLNGSATLIWCDLVKRFSRTTPDEKMGMKVLHGATILFGLVGTLAALAMIRVESALDAWWKISSIFSGGILGLFLLGLIVKRANNVAAALSVTIGVLVIFWLSAADQGWLPDSLHPALHSNLTIVVGTLTIFLIGLTASRLSTPTQNP
ncbi:MAG: sodium:solute symporter [Verrucomicrobiales bacterium]|jgi:SSS family solute:Na+ symporter|nr:sodium:solute symporter [Verrucomicrobiales bacterium]MBP9224748.1 sodium:solute symporter [Verrucomicrobiales bacterium]HQZ28188.1 sodium:solute symporter [Verrucomicrobiales bacterium]